MMHSRDIDRVAPKPRPITLFPDHPHDLDAKRRGLGTDERFENIHTPLEEREGQKDVGLITPLFIILMAFAVVSVVAVAIAGG